MTFLDAVILGVVEGITEFLPISSTGHLILASEMLRLPASSFLKSFEIAIQLGAILSVVTLYLRTFFDKEALKRIAIAFVPTGVIGLAAYPFVKGYLLGSHEVVLWTLALGGVALIAFELWHVEPDDASDGVRNITYRQAFAIGLFQAVAVVPGVSRSAATILGGLLMGVRRTTIVEFSFLIAVPTMCAATGLDLLKSSAVFSGEEYLLLAVGFGVSFFVALGAVKFLLAFVRTHSFIPFGAYRILAALLFFVLVL